MANSFKKLQAQVRTDPARSARVDEIKRAMYTALRLAELRESRHATQRQVADELNVSQANISRIEHESDLYLSTLRNYVEAMGGDLQLIARFPDRPAVAVTGLTGIESKDRRSAKSTAGRRGHRPHGQPARSSRRRASSR